MLKKVETCGENLSNCEWAVSTDSGSTESLVGPLADSVRADITIHTDRLQPSIHPDTSTIDHRPSSTRLESQQIEENEENEENRGGVGWGTTRPSSIEHRPAPKHRGAEPALPRCSTLQHQQPISKYIIYYTYSTQCNDPCRFAPLICDLHSIISHISVYVGLVLCSVQCWTNLLYDYPSNCIL